MRARFQRSYRKEGTGKLVFVFVVSGNAEELAKYKDAQGNFYRESDNGEPLFFSSRCPGQNLPMGFTSKGKPFLDDSKLVAQAAMVEGLGGNLGDAMAAQLAKEALSGGAMGSGGSGVTPSDDISTIEDVMNAAEEEAEEEFEEEDETPEFEEPQP